MEGNRTSQAYLRRAEKGGRFRIIVRKSLSYNQITIEKCNEKKNRYLDDLKKEKESAMKGTLPFTIVTKTETLKSKPN